MEDRSIYSLFCDWKSEKAFKFNENHFVTQVFFALILAVMWIFFGAQPSIALQLRIIVYPFAILLLHRTYRFPRLCQYIDAFTFNLLMIYFVQSRFSDWTSNFENCA
jgi:hypothetical protein